MKVIVIGNQETVWGFSLAGVEGHVVKTATELLKALDATLGDKTIGIVLVTEDVANLARLPMDQRIARSNTPLIVEIPGPDGPDPQRPPLGEIIRQTIGVKI